MLFDSEGGYQAYLIFQPAYRYFKNVTNTNYISLWKSKGLSDESIKPSTTSDNSLTPELSYYDYNIRAKFTGSCLKQSKITYTHKKVVNIYIVYELVYFVIDYVDLNKYNISNVIPYIYKYLMAKYKIKQNVCIY